MAEHPVIGVVTLSPTPDTLALVGGVAIPVAAIERLEISGGRRSRRLVGSLVGAAVGAALGAYDGSKASDPFVSGPAAVIGGVGGGLLGLLVGGLVGRAIPAGPERWEDHPVALLLGRGSRSLRTEPGEHATRVEHGGPAELFD
jgi:hypothetical protein